MTSRHVRSLYGIGKHVVVSSIVAHFTFSLDVDESTGLAVEELSRD